MTDKNAEPKPNEPIKVGIGIIPAEPKETVDRFVEKLKHQTDEMLKKLPKIVKHHWTIPERQYFKEFITTLSKWLYEACRLIESQDAENKALQGQLESCRSNIKLRAEHNEKLQEQLEWQEKKIEELYKDKSHLEEIESDLNNTIGFMQTGIDNWKKNYDDLQTSCEKAKAILKITHYQVGMNTAKKFIEQAQQILGDNEFKEIEGKDEPT
jgi:chromosome segregation ATPase